MDDKMETKNTGVRGHKGDLSNMIVVGSNKNILNPDYIYILKDEEDDDDDGDDDMEMDAESYEQELKPSVSERHGSRKNKYPKRTVTYSEFAESDNDDIEMNPENSGRQFHETVYDRQRSTPSTEREEHCPSFEFAYKEVKVEVQDDDDEFEESSPGLHGNFPLSAEDGGGTCILDSVVRVEDKQGNDYDSTGQELPCKNTCYSSGESDTDFSQFEVSQKGMTLPSETIGNTGNVCSGDLNMLQTAAGLNLDHVNSGGKQRSLPKKATVTDVQGGVQTVQGGVHNNKNSNLHVCETCGKPFKYQCELRKHMATHTGDKPFTCEVCEKSFRSRGHLNDHMRTHSTDRQFQCVICAKTFTSPRYLRRHMKVHFEQGCIPDFLGKTFKRVNPLYDQMSENEGRLQCNICSKSFDCLAYFRRHMQRIHTDIKRYICDTCGKGCKDITNLKVHMRRHSGEKPYPCNVCSKAFPNSSGLQRHLKVHSGQRPCKCKICGKSFYDNSDLKEHMAVHSDFRQLKCGFCCKTFKQNHRLEAHMRLHDGVAPHKCDSCPMSFKFRSQLSKHKQKHLEEVVQCSA